MHFKNAFPILRAQSGTLKNHKRIHSKEKPSECNQF